MLRRAPLDGIEIGHVHALETKPFGIAARQGFRITARNRFARDGVDGEILIPPATFRANGVTVPQIDDADHVEHLYYLPSIEKASTTLPGMKPSEP